ncbi:MAG: hypothetical protein DRJ07_02255 [Bacteroidetes bacterium]|nr:MAG: hypothetical protein DRJ07_02255 [Bacteroidota bacterium]
MTKQYLYKVILFFLISPLFIYSQDIDSAYVDRVNNLARFDNRNGYFSKAYSRINDLISKLDKQKNLENLAFSYQTKADIEQNLGKYEESVKTAKNALKISLALKDSANIAFNYNLVGISYYFLSDYDSTKIYYERSYDLKKNLATDNKGLAASAYNLAILYEDLAQREKALKLYKEAEHYLLKTKDTITFLSDIYVGLAHLYFFNKEIDKAEEYSEKALNVGMKSYGEFNPNMTFVYNSYANILESKKEYKTAIKLLEKSLKIRETTYGKNHKWTCESNYKLATILALDKQYDKAIFYYKQAIDIGEKINSSQYLANAELFLAKLYIEQDIHLNEAEKLILSALDKNMQVFGYKNDIIAEDYYYLAKLAKKRNDKERMFAFITRALNSASYDKNYLEEVIAAYQALNVLVLMGDWYKDDYKRTNNINALEDNFKLIDQEIALIEYIQKNFSSDQSKINLANEYRKIFEKGLNTCWILYHKSKDQKYLEKAFELSEANRNTTLLEGLQDTKFKLYSGIPKKLLEKEKGIKQALERVKIDLYYEKIASDPDKEFLTKLLDKRILLSKRLDSIHSFFKKEYPRYANLKYRNKVIGISDVQKNLERNTQLLIYFLGDHNLYSFNITKDKITFLKGAVADDLSDKTLLFKSELIARNDIRKVSKTLYQYLLKQQLNKTKENLVIIPDNVLNYIPFEILQNDKNEYLLKNYSVCYSGSVRLLLELKNDYFTYTPLKFWAGFSPEYTNENTLSFASKEVNTINEIVEGDLFIGENSKKQIFLDNNKNYSVLHLAMHAKINNEYPQFNKLVFTDGELTASEIYLSNTKANLTVLSACNTGFGKIEKGEGVMSMARAFHFSGVPSVLMSLWKIPDKETNKIMISFYKYLKKGENKSEALRKAKIEYLALTSDKNLSHPFYWSGFVLNGNSDQLFPKNNIYYYFLLGLVVTAILFLILKKVKQN